MGTIYLSFSLRKFHNVMFVFVHSLVLLRKLVHIDGYYLFITVFVQVSQCKVCICSFYIGLLRKYFFTLMGTISFSH